MAQIQARPAAPPKVDLRSLLARYGTLIGLALMIVVFSASRPTVFPTVSNFMNILNQVAILALISLGLTSALVLGDFDLSVGATASMGGVLAIGMLDQKYSIPLVFLAVTCIGIVIGMVNGFLVTKVRLTAFIATLGTTSIISGLIFWYTKGATLFKGVPADFLIIGRGKIWFLPNLVVIMLAVLLVLWFVLAHTELGRHMYAIGGNPEAARLAGIALDRTRTISFIITSVSAAMAGVLLSSRLGSAHPTAGDGYLLSAFAAAFLGASTLRDGEFHVGGTFVGVIIMGVTMNGLTIVGTPFFVQNIVTGGALLLAVSLSGVLTKRE